MLLQHPQSGSLPPVFLGWMGVVDDSSIFQRRDMEVYIQIYSRVECTFV